MALLQPCARTGTCTSAARRSFFAWLKSLFGWRSAKPAPWQPCASSPGCKAMRAAMAAVMAETVGTLADAADGIAPR